jgi:hypothetical protein
MVADEEEMWRREVWMRTRPERRGMLRAVRLMALMV